MDAAAQLRGSTPSLAHQCAERLTLATGFVEVLRAEPRLEDVGNGRPLAIEHREPRRVAIAAFHDRGLPEHAFEREAEALRRRARRGIQRVALPFVSPIPQL